MPRDGSGVYTRPPGTDAVPDTTIESSKYNNFVGDVETDLNAVRPIIAGGTGGSNGTTARANMQAERAEQQVTNYSFHAWESGSFWSAAGATGAPNSTDGFTGTVTRLADGAADKWTVVARSRQTGAAYVSQKVAGGAWSAWVADASDKVAKAGDTMTGNLTINTAPPTWPMLELSTTELTAQLQFRMSRDNKMRWAILTQGGSADENTNPTGLLGSNFEISRARNNGTFVDSPLVIARDTGLTTFNANVTINGSAQVITNLTIGANTYANDIYVRRPATNTGAIYFGDQATGPAKFIFYNAAGQFQFSGGGINATNDITTPNLVVTAHQGMYHTVAGGSYARLMQTVSGVRQWSTGAMPDGRYAISDESGAASRLIFDTAGNATFPSMNVHATNFYGNHRGNIYDCAGLYFVSGGGIEGAYLIDFLHPGYSEDYSSRLLVNNARQLECYTHQFHVVAGPTGGANMNADGWVYANYGYRCNTGGNHPDGYTFAITWPGPGFYIGGTYVGNLSLVSDYRIKRDVHPLPSMWDRVKALEPVQYMHKEYTPDSLKETAKAAGPFIVDDGVQHWGFVAHKVQEALLPSAATATKDDPKAVQGLNLAPIVASLTRALQEAMARIEALEAKLAT